MLPTVEIHCPYCGEGIELFVDDSAGAQSYIEDCPVCCRPIEVAVTFDHNGDPQVLASGEDDA